jgi:hypothetical protein
VLSGMVKVQFTSKASCTNMSCLKCPKGDWCVADCSSGSRSEKRCTPARQFSRRPFWIGPPGRVETPTHVGRHSQQEKLQGNGLHIYFAWLLNCVMIPCRAYVIKSEYQSSIGDATLFAREDYFWMNPMFETSSKKYDWMNRIIVVGTGDRLPDGPVYSIFEVL